MRRTVCTPSEFINNMNCFYSCRLVLALHNGFWEFTNDCDKPPIGIHQFLWGQSQIYQEMSADLTDIDKKS